MDVAKRSEIIGLLDRTTSASGLERIAIASELALLLSVTDPGGVDGAYVSWSLDSNPLYNDEGDEIGEDEYVLIEKIYVPKEHRGKGVARRILRDELKRIKSQHPGIPVRLAAYPFEHGADGDDGIIEMDALVAFYEKEGFDIINTDGHAVIMEFDGRIRG